MLFLLCQKKIVIVKNYCVAFTAPAKDNFLKLATLFVDLSQKTKTTVCKFMYVRVHVDLSY